MSKISEKVYEEIMRAGGLRRPENLGKLSEALVRIVLNDLKPKEGLKHFLKQYYYSIENYNPNEEEVEKMLSGILAFFWVNYDGEPYMPTFMYPEQEVNKKWWQFWK